MIKNRILWIDNIRAVACLMVIIIHVSASYLYLYNTIPHGEWLTANFIDSACRVSVPLFFMVSGFFFMGQDNYVKKKNFFYLIKMLLFFSILSVAYLMSTKNVSYYNKLPSLLFSPPFFHLWFFYALIVIYSFFYIFQCRNYSSRHIIFTIALFIIINPTTIILINKIFDLNLRFLFISIEDNNIYYLLYALLGYQLGNYKFENHIKIKTLLIINLLLYIASTYVTFKMTTILTLESDGKYNGTFYNYKSLSVFISSLSLFIYIKYLQLDKLQKVMSNISKHSIFIYGFHAIILDPARTTFNMIDKYSAYVFIPIAFVIILSVSYGLSVVIFKLDRSKWLIK